MFKRTTEKQVTRAIVSRFSRDMDGFADMDVLIVGSGPSGLMAARDLAREGVRVLVIERNNYLGGGFWVGGFLMNTVTVREPAQEILDEVGVPYEEAEEGLYTASGPHACSKLIAAACDAGARVLNMARFDDVVLREGNRVSGAVINWSPVMALPREITCVDPVALEGRWVVDASGHDAAVVSRLADRRILEVQGCGGMWIADSEDSVLERTGEVHPGLHVTGMAVSATYGLTRMGPTFGAMLMSGRRCAQRILEDREKGGIDHRAGESGRVVPDSGR